MGMGVGPVDVVALSARTLADFFARIDRAMGSRHQAWGDLHASDPGSADAFLNNSVLVRPADPARPDGIASRLAAFYRAGPGGGYVVWDPWQTAGLDAFGFEHVELPCMVRPPGGAADPLPRGLEIERVRDRRSLAAFEDALIEGFPLEHLVAGRPPAFWDQRILAVPGLGIWLGRAAGRPVSCGLSFVSRGYVFVGFVATVPSMRGRGFGSAIAWAATLAASRLPAILHASRMGRPMYERMGFGVVAPATLWWRDDR